MSNERSTLLKLAHHYRHAVTVDLKGGVTHLTGGVVLPNILGGGVPHGSQKPDPISEQNV